MFAAALAGFAHPAQAAVPTPFLIVETGARHATLQRAVDAIGEGSGTIRIAPGTYRECAVQKAGKVTFQAATSGTVIFDGVACEGKAALVLRGQGARVEGIVFQNMRVPDGNGAGIRLEQRDLTVFNSLFRNSEEGILTADDKGSSLTIDRSTFSGLGRCDRGLACAHSVYTGWYTNVTVTRSRFEKGTGGHYLKTRAVNVTITDNVFDDTKGRGTNYHIDLCSGSTGTVARNNFVQGANKENYSAIIAVAAEESRNPSKGLVVDGNRASLPVGVTWTTSFIADWSGEPLGPGRNALGNGLRAIDHRTR